MAWQQAAAVVRVPARRTRLADSLHFAAAPSTQGSMEDVTIRQQYDVT